MDVFHAINRKVMWSNSMGLGYAQSQATFLDADTVDTEGPDATSIGAYFITTFDVTMFGDLGFWMDWGCQVVGPTTARDAANEKSTIWHMNPMGAGGFRYSF